MLFVWTQTDFHNWSSSHETTNQSGQWIRIRIRSCKYFKFLVIKTMDLNPDWTRISIKWIRIRNKHCCQSTVTNNYHTRVTKDKSEATTVWRKLNNKSHGDPTHGRADPKHRVSEWDFSLDPIHIFTIPLSSYKMTHWISFLNRYIHTCEIQIFTLTNSQTKVKQLWRQLNNKSHGDPTHGRGGPEACSPAAHARSYCKVSCRRPWSGFI